MSAYYRPLVQIGLPRPKTALPIAAGWCWFDHVERLERGEIPVVIPTSDVPAETLLAIASPRDAIAGFAMDRPRLMGILNVTPDSFSDGGQFDEVDRAVGHALDMAGSGADIIDIGGESTRPGADIVPEAQEIARTHPVIDAIRQISAVPISIDTRKAPVAKVALHAGANIVNDVSALGFDAKLSDIVATNGVPVCLMHAQGAPKTMQNNPAYGDVLLEVYDHLAERIKFAQSHGISREKIIIDPGIGFGKTSAHNLALIGGISLFHSLGCPILLGPSRKGFIAKVAAETVVAGRLAGSISLALFGIAQGVQITRVHDIAEMRQALTMWQAAAGIRQQE